jgi:uncharacterized SAM-binding protein YcdF (DUF218 family)
MPFALKKALSALLVPPAGLFVLMVVGYALRRAGARRTGDICIGLSLALLFLLSLPTSAALLGWLVYDGSRFDPAAAANAQAIVVLGGGMRIAPEYGGDTLGRLTLERVRYAARIAREVSLPVLVTGGHLFTLHAEGEVMRDALELELGVPVRWVESCARDTHENARFSARLLHAAGISRVILVSHGVDARRARREFSAAGLKVYPAPTRIPDLGLDSAYDLFPSAPALDESSLAIYEALANLALDLGLNASSPSRGGPCMRAPGMRRLPRWRRFSPVVQPLRRRRSAPSSRFALRRRGDRHVPRRRLTTRGAGVHRHPARHATAHPHRPPLARAVRGLLHQPHVRPPAAVRGERLALRRKQLELRDLQRRLRRQRGHRLEAQVRQGLPRLPRIEPHLDAHAARLGEVGIHADRLQRERFGIEAELDVAGAGRRLRHRQGHLEHLAEARLLRRSDVHLQRRRPGLSAHRLGPLQGPVARVDGLVGEVRHAVLVDEPVERLGRTRSCMHAQQGGEQKQAAQEH